MLPVYIYIHTKNIHENKILLISHFNFNTKHILHHILSTSQKKTISKAYSTAYYNTDIIYTPKRLHSYIYNYIIMYLFIEI